MVVALKDTNSTQWIVSNICFKEDLAMKQNLGIRVQSGCHFLISNINL